MTQLVICDQPIDITYLPLRRGGFVYLTAVMDVVTRQIRGWELSRSLDGRLTLNALDRALRQGKPTIHHSDQDVQYAANDYVERLVANEVSISMATSAAPKRTAMPND